MGFVFVLKLYVACDCAKTRNIPVRGIALRIISPARIQDDAYYNVRA